MAALKMFAIELITVRFEKYIPRLIKLSSQSFRQCLRFGETGMNEGGCKVFMLLIAFKRLHFRHVRLEQDTGSDRFVVRETLFQQHGNSGPILAMVAVIGIDNHNSLTTGGANSLQSSLQSPEGFPDWLYNRHEIFASQQCCVLPYGNEFELLSTKIRMIHVRLSPSHGLGKRRQHRLNQPVVLASANLH